MKEIFFSCGKNHLRYILILHFQMIFIYCFVFIYSYRPLIVKKNETLKTVISFNIVSCDLINFKKATHFLPANESTNCA